MNMEYVVGPVIALMLGMKFTDWRTKLTEKKVSSMEAEMELVQTNLSEVESTVEVISTKIDAVDTVILPKVMQTLQPVTRAVVRLNQEVGIQ